MELLYLWIEDFRNIKKQGFDFSSEFKFEVVSKNESQGNLLLGYELFITPNENYVELFDGNIVNVTGIVGKNGSGKSSLLHCIKIMTGELSVLLCPLIFCLRDRITGTINTYYYGGGHQEMIPLNVTVKAEKSIIRKYTVNAAKAYSINRFGFDGKRIKGLDFEFSEIASCFFSNTFDSHRENIYEGIFNVSTNYKTEEYLKQYILSVEKLARKKKPEVPAIDIWPSHIYQYHKKELQGLLRFLSYAESRKKKPVFKLPNTINIDFKADDYEFLINEGNGSYLYNSDILKQINQQALGIINQTKDKNLVFMNMVILMSFYHVLKKDLLNPEIVSMNKTRLLIETLPNLHSTFFETLRTILSPLKKLRGESFESRTISDFLGKSFENAVMKLNFSDMNSELVSNSIIHYRLNIEYSLWSVLSVIFDLQALNDASFMDYSWGTGISTGQEAFLTHYARLHELKSNVGSKPVLLLIDEGDLYFHPEWQKKYFSQLIDYVKFLFPRNKVQIILTTHSPFIASDLPKQNLIFLKQDEEEMCKVSNNDIQFETFGSNIHELFTDSFFLEDGLMGEFARTKISELIEEIDHAESISEEEFELKYKNRIAIVGESFIKAKLYEMVAGKSNNNVIDTIIDQRNKEIDTLRLLKNKENNGKN